MSDSQRETVEIPVAGKRPDELYELSPSQRRFFDAFGYLLIPGLLADDIGEISESFDKVMADPNSGGSNLDYAAGDRLAVPAVLDLHPTLSALKADPRILGIVHSLIGDDWQYAQSDGNVMDCETTWHRDTYCSPLSQFHVKILFYLDPLTADTGALRVMPGTNHHCDSYIKTILPGCGFPDRMHDLFGIDSHQLPAVALETNPGDAIIINFRTLHASFRGNTGRRLFTVNFKEPGDPPA